MPYSVETVRMLPGRAGLALLLAAALMFPAYGAGGSSWQPDRSVDGIDLESRPTPSGYHEFRGSTVVCTSLEALQAFVGDAARFTQWIPFTESARALPDTGAGERYYVRTSTPWPLKSRDMVYELNHLPTGADGTVRITMRGVPDALPVADDAVRLDGAEGLWTLRPRDGGIEVSLELAVNPGGAPAFLANRRLAATVGGTLANLGRQFPCDA